MIKKSNIKVLAEALRNAHADKLHGATVLIGAGVSVTAGIPAATGIIQEIEERFPDHVAHHQPQGYQNHMKILHPNQRKLLINRHVNAAKINWAHLALAQLIAGGYVTRVLTTNFDPLVSRACALLHEFPAIYDYANPPQRFDSKMLPDKAVFHLHGQHTGFVLRNTDEEVQEYSDRIAELLRDSTHGRPIIVVGYSGDCDPVFNCLTNLVYDNSLYWVPFKDSVVPDVVRDRLLSKEYTYTIPGYDADGFFCELAKALDCFPPRLVEEPFSHLKVVLETVGEYIPHGQSAPMPILWPTFDSLGIAIDQQEKGVPATAARPALPSVSSLWVKLMLDKHEYVAKLFEGCLEDIPEGYKNVAVAAWLNWGNMFCEMIRLSSGVKGREPFEQACQKYEAALKIKQNSDKALYNWGNAFYYLSVFASRGEAKELLENACKKYESALKVNPEKFEALSNLGVVLSALARLDSGGEAKVLLAKACEKYEATLNLKPDADEALYNWGIALSDLANLTSGDAARELSEQACRRFAASLRIKPDYCKALDAWGTALISLAMLASDPAEHLRLLGEAQECCKRADALKEGEGDYNLACAASLLGEPDVARDWLVKAKAAGTLPARTHLEADSDLESLRELEWFQAFLASAD